MRLSGRCRHASRAALAVCFLVAAAAAAAADAPPAKPEEGAAKAGDPAKSARAALRKPRFVDLGTGIVHDRKSGLQWSQRDDGNEYNFPYAVAFCENLDLSGRGWRLPTRKQWTELVQASDPEPIECGDRVCRIPPQFKLQFPWVWTSERDGEVNAWKFDLTEGTPFSEIAEMTVHGRAVCVRRHADAARAAKPK